MNGDDKKLIKHTDHLVAFMVSIIRKWRVTQALRLGQYPAIRENGLAATGFDVCTDTLFYSVIHDLDALMFDEGRRTPSLRTSLQILDRPGVEARFRARFLSSAACDGGSQTQDGSEFDNTMQRLRAEIPAVIDGGDATACRRARDRYTAHFWLQDDGCDYKRLDLQHFGLSLDTPNRLIKRLRPRIDDLCLVTQRDAHAWDTYAQQSEQISDELATELGGQAGFMPDIEEMKPQIEAIVRELANRGREPGVSQQGNKAGINIVRADD
ncbi:hypothetical protein [Congregibacter litoralis]|uniref:HEPN AbiU2-like domain-containing protein n=1 Tax=Congregibacter litoralis KT71 TaxID=314285 RepID=A4A4R0_9GAMM|nr:hypothetical protein [Congregibacter litoralis]EAQ98781.2 hypothetical protein KT71_09147 [Congregibacter litoralis KT71]